MIPNRSQRWRDRRASFVPDATVIDPTIHSVDVIDSYRTAKPFVESHHYAGSYPASRLAVGMYRNGAAGRSELVGVCCFSVPMNNASIKLQTGLNDPLAGVDLGRLVLLDHIEGNAESWFVSRAFRLLRQHKPGIVSVIAYSDPVRRIAPDGTVTLPGHVGQVYSALGAKVRGRSSARTDFIMPNGRIISPRAIAKIRSDDTGAAYAARQIAEAGAPERSRGEDPRDWIIRLEKSGFLAKRRHPGCWVYNFPLTQAARIASRSLPSLAYPRIDYNVTQGDVSALPLLAAA